MKSDEKSDEAQRLANADKKSGSDNGEEEDGMELSYTEAERFITFTDAVVAIAMTLLILPLMEDASALSEEDEDGEMTIVDYFSTNKHTIGSFFLSFLVVSIFWVRHDNVFRHVGRFSLFLVILNILWMLGLVFLPVATSLLTVAPDEDKLGLVVYIGTMLWTSCTGTVMVHVIQKDNRIWKGDKGPGKLELISNVIQDVLFLIALVISIFFKMTGAYILIVVTVAVHPIVMKLIKRRWPELR